MKGLNNHNNIVKILGYGSKGAVTKKGKTIVDNLTYILMEYVEGGCLYDLCQSLGGMGEDIGRFFLI